MKTNKIIIASSVAIITTLVAFNKFDTKANAEVQMPETEKAAMSSTTPALSYTPNLYMLESTVTDVTDTNTVHVTTTNGDKFAFKGNGTWLPKDGVILLLDNQGTETIKDDIIIDTLYDNK